MMKKSSVLALFLTLGLAVSVLSGCGGSNVRADQELEGKYIAVLGEMWGISMSGDDLDGFAFDLQSGGKAVMTIDGDSHKVKWQNDDDTITITIDSENMVGTRGTDSFKVENILDMGMDITFAKEGTAAAEAGQYLPEKEKFMLGKWQSVSVADILGDPVEGVAADALSLEFTGDHMMTASLGGQDLGSHKWSLLGDWGSVDDDELNLSWDITDDGLEVSYSNDDDYLVFACAKAE